MVTTQVETNYIVIYDPQGSCYVSETRNERGELIYRYKNASGNYEYRPQNEKEEKGDPVFPITDSCERNAQLMNTDEVRLVFNSAKKVVFKPFSYIEYDNQTFFLKERYTPNAAGSVKDDNGNTVVDYYKYDLKFCSIANMLTKYICYRHVIVEGTSGRQEFDEPEININCNLETMYGIIVSSINAVSKRIKPCHFSNLLATLYTNCYDEKNSKPTDAVKLTQNDEMNDYSFSSMDISSVCTQVCNTLTENDKDTEWWIEEKIETTQISETQSDTKHYLLLHMAKCELTDDITEINDYTTEHSSDPSSKNYDPFHPFESGGLKSCAYEKEWSGIEQIVTPYGATRNMKDVQETATDLVTNLMVTYGKRLRLDPNTQYTVYRKEDKESKSNPKTITTDDHGAISNDLVTTGIEKTQFYEDIYPQCHFRVTKVTTRMKHKSDVDYLTPEYTCEAEMVQGGNYSTKGTPVSERDLAEWGFYPLKIEEGQTLSVRFESGLLNGREFEISNKTTKDETDGQDSQGAYARYSLKFTIVSTGSAEDGNLIPSGNFIPKGDYSSDTNEGVGYGNGDQFALFNMKMPQEFINKAKQELAQKAYEELVELQETRPAVKCKSEPKWWSVGREIFFGKRFKVQSDLFGDPEEDSYSGNENLLPYSNTIKDNANVVLSPNANAFNCTPNSYSDGITEVDGKYTDDTTLVKEHDYEEKTSYEDEYGYSLIPPVDLVSEDRYTHDTGKPIAWSKANRTGSEYLNYEYKNFSKYHLHKNGDVKKVELFRSVEDLPDYEESQKFPRIVYRKTKSLIGSIEFYDIFLLYYEGTEIKDEEYSCVGSWYLDFLKKKYPNADVQYDKNIYVFYYSDETSKQWSYEFLPDATLEKVAYRFRPYYKDEEKKEKETAGDERGEEQASLKAEYADNGYFDSVKVTLNGELISGYYKNNDVSITDENDVKYVYNSIESREGKAYKRWYNADLNKQIYTYFGYAIGQDTFVSEDGTLVEDSKIKDISADKIWFSEPEDGWNTLDDVILPDYWNTLLYSYPTYDSNLRYEHQYSKDNQTIYEQKKGEGGEWDYTGNTFPTLPTTHTISAGDGAITFNANVPHSEKGYVASIYVENNKAISITDENDAEFEYEGATTIDGTNYIGWYSDTLNKRVYTEENYAVGSKTLVWGVDEEGKSVLVEDSAVKSIDNYGLVMEGVNNEGSAVEIPVGGYGRYSIVCQDRKVDTFVDSNDYTYTKSGDTKEVSEVTYLGWYCASNKKTIYTEDGNEGVGDTTYYFDGLEMVAYSTIKRLVDVYCVSFTIKSQNNTPINAYLYHAKIEEVDEESEQPTDWRPKENTEYNMAFVSRCTQFSYKLTKPCEIDFTLASSTVKGVISSMQSAIADATSGVAGVSQRAVNLSRRGWHDAAETASMIDSIQTEMMLVGDEKNQFAFTFSVEPVNNADGIFEYLSIGYGSLQHTQEPWTKNNFQGLWYVNQEKIYKTGKSKETSFVDETAYYVFAECNDNDQTATIIVAEGDEAAQYRSDSDTNHFLLGTLSSIFENERVFNRTNGYSAIAGGTITTEQIQDAGRNLIIDFQSNPPRIIARNGAQIIGNMSFYDSEGAANELASAIASLKESMVDGNLLPTQNWESLKDFELEKDDDGNVFAYDRGFTSVNDKCAVDNKDNSTFVLTLNVGLSSNGTEQVTNRDTVYFYARYTDKTADEIGKIQSLGTLVTKEFTFNVPSLKKLEYVEVVKYESTVKFTLYVQSSLKAPESSKTAWKYLVDAMQHGSTEVEGGLVMTQILGLKDSDNKTITAGMSGKTEDGVLLWGGGSYEEASNAVIDDYKKASGSKELITTLIKKNGQGKIGCFRIDDDTVEVLCENGEKILISDKNIEDLVIEQEDHSANFNLSTNQYEEGSQNYSYNEHVFKTMEFNVSDGDTYRLSIGGSGNVAGVRIVAGGESGEISADVGIGRYRLKIVNNDKTLFDRDIVWAKDDLGVEQEDLFDASFDISYGDDPKESYLSYGSVNVEVYECDSNKDVFTLEKGICKVILYAVSCRVSIDGNNNENGDYAFELNYPTITLHSINRYSVFGKNGIAIITSSDNQFIIYNNDNEYTNVVVKGLPSKSYAGLKAGQMFVDRSSASSTYQCLMIKQ